jgi:hypothetical protein
MSDPMLDEKRRYHQVLHDRLKAGGRSPHQTATHARMLALGEGSTDTLDWQARIEAENLDFALARAMSADTWLAKAFAARDDDNPELADALEQAAQAIAEAPDSAALNDAAMAAEERARVVGQRQSDLRHAFIGVIYAAWQFQTRHIANHAEREKFAAEARGPLGRIAAAGMTFAQLCAAPFCRKYGPPWTDAQWQALIATVDSLARVERDEAAQRQVSNEALQLLDGLAPRGQELATMQAEIDKRTKRQTYLAHRLADEPGDYEFEQLWEGEWR